MKTAPTRFGKLLPDGGIAGDAKRRGEDLNALPADPHVEVVQALRGGTCTLDAGAKTLTVDEPALRWALPPLPPRCG